LTPPYKFYIKISSIVGFIDFFEWSLLILVVVALVVDPHGRAADHEEREDEYDNKQNPGQS
jgi:hypothetical protein